MKIFDVEYHFYRSWRKARFYIKQNLRWRRLVLSLNQKKFLLYGMLSLIALCFLLFLVTKSLRQKPSVPKEIVPPVEVVTPKDVPPKVKKIPDGSEAPEVSAKAVLITEGSTGEVLLEKNADESLPPASITKVLTAILALENFKIDEEVVVPTQCIGLAGSQIGLVAQEKWTVKEMLYGVLVPSASDATCSLASHVSQVTDYVAAMNLRAQALGLKQTRFMNPIGLEDPGHRSSARDLVVLGRYAMQNATIREIVGTTSITIHGRKVENTDELLGKVDGLVGIKTGFTDEAGECFLFSVERDGRNITGVVLGSKDRFGEADQLIDWVYKTHVWE